jgi:hypothetical protein
MFSDFLTEQLALILDGVTLHLVPSPSIFFAMKMFRNLGYAVVWVCLPRVHVLKSDLHCEVLRGWKLSLCMVFGGGLFER